MGIISDHFAVERGYYIRSFAVERVVGTGHALSSPGPVHDVTREWRRNIWALYPTICGGVGALYPTICGGVGVLYPTIYGGAGQGMPCPYGVNPGVLWCAYRCIPGVWVDIRGVGVWFKP